MLVWTKRGIARNRGCNRLQSKTATLQSKTIFRYFRPEFTGDSLHLGCADLTRSEDDLWAYEKVGAIIDCSAATNIDADARAEALASLDVQTPHGIGTGSLIIFAGRMSLHRVAPVSGRFLSALSHTNINQLFSLRSHNQVHSKSGSHPTRERIRLSADSVRVRQLFWVTRPNMSGCPPNDLFLPQ
jgi:hypothetical protein